MKLVHRLSTLLPLAALLVGCASSTRQPADPGNGPARTVPVPAVPPVVVYPNGIPELEPQTPPPQAGPAPVMFSLTPKGIEATETSTFTLGLINNTGETHRHRSAGSSVDCDDPFWRIQLIASDGTIYDRHPELADAVCGDAMVEPRDHTFAAGEQAATIVIDLQRLHYKIPPAAVGAVGVDTRSHDSLKKVRVPTGTYRIVVTGAGVRAESGVIVR